MRKGKKLVIANWKMNPEKLSEAKSLFQGIKRSALTLRNVETVVCPPFVFLHALRNTSSGKQFSLGAQDVFYKEKGSFTGEISPLQIKDTGARYVIIGHSERRRLGETNDDVHEKIILALKQRLIPVVCVGESERDSHGKYLTFLRKQINSAFKKIKTKDAAKIIIAYEPIWAIGKTGQEAITPVKLHETTLFIRRVLRELYTKGTALDANILYGGSVEPENAEELLREGDVQGFLVGHASLNVQTFNSILKTAQHL